MAFRESLLWTRVVRYGSNATSLTRIDARMPDGFPDVLWRNEDAGRAGMLELKTGRWQTARAARGATPALLLKHPLTLNQRAQLYALHNEGWHVRVLVGTATDKEYFMGVRIVDAFDRVTRAALNALCDGVVPRALWDKYRVAYSGFTPWLLGDE